MGLSYHQLLTDLLIEVDKIPLRFCFIKESDQYTRRYKAYFTKDDGQGFSVSYGDLATEAIQGALDKYNEKTAR